MVVLCVAGGVAVMWEVGSFAWGQGEWGVVGLCQSVCWPAGHHWQKVQ